MRALRQIRGTAHTWGKKQQSGRTKSTLGAMSSLSPGWNTEGTVAVVTGAGHGIGFHIASQLANDAGMQVLVTSRDSKNAQSAAELIGNGCVGTQLDIADVSKAVPEFARWIQEQYGGIDVLVNNASIAFHRDAFSGPEAKQVRLLLY